MHIAILSPVSPRSSPSQNGLWEEISFLKKGLNRRGVETTLFLPDDPPESDPSASDGPRRARVWEGLHIIHGMEQADRFDLIHNYCGFLPLTYCGLIRTPMVTTLYEPPSPGVLPIYKRYSGRTFYVSSDNAARHPELEYIATIRRRCQPVWLPFNGPDGYFLSPERTPEGDGREALKRNGPASAQGGIPGSERQEGPPGMEEGLAWEVMVEQYLRVYGMIVEEAAAAGARRPWGSFTVLEDRSAFKVKCIEVLPDRRLSSQSHRGRSEHWMIVQGQAKVTLGGREIDLAAGGAVDIPQGSIHRIANPGKEPLVFIEIQTGEYFGEDDIVRLEDDYGRAGR